MKRLLSLLFLSYGMTAFAQEAPQANSNLEQKQANANSPKTHKSEKLPQITTERKLPTVKSGNRTNVGRKD